ncbi:DUF1775 domain-containing protein [Streptomyces sp. TLI_105]|uniref:DUF1775 domain-containing protein n=1 Tax=Streptomyces sp. TLI_105 TaxID=1881019 RepID=UPI00089825AE|nr:DUF1775 domain-containing protein [Streptomyces sp. TLI_105]SEC01310.1 LPXTG-motif cell wall anchor domain-containing protein [Streptomyces sp. TLI_105]
MYRTLRARAPFVAAATLAASLAMTTSAFAHVEVEAENPRALAENVELSFNAESESPTAGIAKLEVVLPEGIKPSDVAYKSGPAGWRLTPTDRGYAVSGPAVAAGEDAAYKVVIRQLPDAKSLAFKTLQTYSDGRVDRWIELEKSHGDGGHSGSPAPVLELGPAAPGAEPVAPSTAPATTPIPTAAPTSAAPTTPAASDAKAGEGASEAEDSSPNTLLMIVGVAVLALATAGVLLWNRRRDRADG